MKTISKIPYERRLKMSKARKAYYARLTESEKEKIYSQARAKKISVKRKEVGAPWLVGRIINQDTREKISKAQLGKKLSDEHKQKIRLAHLGKMVWNKDKTFPEYSEDRSIFWKGEKVGYRALHMWVAKHRGKASSCTVNVKHQSSRFHWANISQEYKRDLNDWISLCPKCHRQYDLGRVSL